MALGQLCRLATAPPVAVMAAGGFAELTRDQPTTSQRLARLLRFAAFGSPPPPPPPKWTGFSTAPTGLSFSQHALAAALVVLDRTAALSSADAEALAVALGNQSKALSKFKGSRRVDFTYVLPWSLLERIVAAPVQRPKQTAADSAAVAAAAADFERSLASLSWRLAAASHALAASGRAHPAEDAVDGLELIISALSGDALAMAQAEAARGGPVADIVRARLLWTRAAGADRRASAAAAAAAAAAVKSGGAASRRPEPLADAQAVVDRRGAVELWRLIALRTPPLPAGVLTDLALAAIALAEVVKIDDPAEFSAFGPWASPYLTRVLLGLDDARDGGSGAVPASPAAAAAAAAGAAGAGSTYALAYSAVRELAELLGVRVPVTARDAQRAPLGELGRLLREAPLDGLAPEVDAVVAQRLADTCRRAAASDPSRRAGEVPPELRVDCDALVPAIVSRCGLGGIGVAPQSLGAPLRAALAELCASPACVRAMRLRDGGACVRAAVALEAQHLPRWSERSHDGALLTALLAARLCAPARLVEALASPSSSAARAVDALDPTLDERGGARGASEEVRGALLDLLLHLAGAGVALALASGAHASMRGTLVSLGIATHLAATVAALPRGHGGLGDKAAALAAALRVCIAPRPATGDLAALDARGLVDLLRRRDALQQLPEALLRIAAARVEREWRPHSSGAFDAPGHESVTTLLPLLYQALQPGVPERLRWAEPAQLQLQLARAVAAVASDQKQACAPKNSDELRAQFSLMLGVVGLEAPALAVTAHLVDAYSSQDALKLFLKRSLPNAVFAVLDRALRSAALSEAQKTGCVRAAARAVGSFVFDAARVGRDAVRILRLHAGAAPKARGAELEKAFGAELAGLVGGVLGGAGGAGSAAAAPEDPGDALVASVVRDFPQWAGIVSGVLRASDGDRTSELSWWPAAAALARALRLQHLLPPASAQPQTQLQPQPAPHAQHALPAAAPQRSASGEASGWRCGMCGTRNAVTAQNCLACSSSREAEGKE